MTLTLDRMELDDVGANPARVATAILKQARLTAGPAPIEEIARALDIVEVRREQLTNFEGALVTTPERGSGKILVNARSNRQRQRFTIGHELFHFLSPRHVPTHPDGFRRKREDFRLSLSPGLDRHLRQEAEANAFSIELLAPALLVRRHLSPRPDLADVIAISDDMDISREAAARRYVEVRDEALAALVSRHGRMIYPNPSSDFPKLVMWRNELLPDLPTVPDEIGVSDIEDANPADWLRSPTGDLTVQTLHQQHGWAITLLHHTVDEDEEHSEEDSFERYSRFGRDD